MVGFDVADQVGARGHVGAGGLGDGGGRAFSGRDKRLRHAELRPIAAQGQALGRERGFNLLARRAGFNADEQALLDRGQRGGLGGLRSLCSLHCLRSGVWLLGAGRSREGEGQDGHRKDQQQACGRSIELNAVAWLHNRRFRTRVP